MTCEILYRGISILKIGIPSKLDQGLVYMPVSIILFHELIKSICDNFDFNSILRASYKKNIPTTKNNIINIIVKYFFLIKIFPKF